MTKIVFLQTLFRIKLHHFTLRICPHCYSTFFPANNTMSFRNEISDKTREIWLSVLNQNIKDPAVEGDEMIDHGEPSSRDCFLITRLNYVTTCCDMFHLPPSLTCQILERTLKSPFHATRRSKYAKSFLHSYFR